MQKDFDGWNKQKKEIDSSGENKFYHPREIWYCLLGVNVGFEQDGTGGTKERPVLIIQGFSKHVCVVIPLTTKSKEGKFYINIGNVTGRESNVILSQIRLIDTKRLINKIATLDEGLFQKIKKAVKDLL